MLKWNMSQNLCGMLFCFTKTWFYLHSLTGGDYFVDVGVWVRTAGVSSIFYSMVFHHIAILSLFAKRPGYPFKPTENPVGVGTEVGCPGFDPHLQSRALRRRGHGMSPCRGWRFCSFVGFIYRCWPALSG